MARSTVWARVALGAVDVVWWVTLAAVLAVAAVMVLIAAHALGGRALTLDSYFQLPSAAYRISAHQLAGSSARLGLSAGPLGFARPRVGFVLVCAVVLAVSAAAWLFILHQLRRLLAALRAGQTFARENELRLRRIGVAVIVFELGHALVVWAGGLYLKHAVHARGVSLRSHFGVDVMVVLLGVLLLALAAAFRVGFELSEEQALTV
jgi:hypothetical protein